MSNYLQYDETNDLNSLLNAQLDISNAIVDLMPTILDDDSSFDDELIRRPMFNRIYTGKEGSINMVVEEPLTIFLRGVAHAHSYRQLCEFFQHSLETADRSLRQNESIQLERLRIDIEDFNLHAVESLNGHPYLAVGKHLCGNATDLTINCCHPQKTDGSKKAFSSSCHLQGIALATCCHHICQWKHYSNRRLFLDHGITKQDFYAITWFSSWAVDADHSSNLSNQSDRSMDTNAREANEAQKLCGPVECFMGDRSVEETIRNMKAVDRAAFGFKCKDIIDMGRVLWLREHGLDAVLVKYVPHKISPENHLLLAKFR